LGGGTGDPVSRFHPVERRSGDPEVTATEEVRNPVASHAREIELD
jgi:hypothetical protein